MKISLNNGRVIDPANGIDATLSVHIEDSKIAAIGDAPENWVADENLDLSGQIICPGLIDLCARPRLSGADTAHELRKELHAAVAGGITRVVCPPDTRPVIDLPATALLEQDLAADIGLAKIHPLGATTVGLKGEKLTDMAMLQYAGCVGVSNALEPVPNTLVMRRAMQYASTYDITVFLTPFDPYLQGNGCIHEGKISTLLGLPSIPEAAEVVAVARDLALIETSGVNAHFHLLSTARSVEMIRQYQKSGLPVTASVAAHQLHLTENDIINFDAKYKVIPPLRSKKDRKALRKGIKNGTISSICSDHQSRGNDTKIAPFSEASTGIVGFQTLLPLTLALVDDGICSMPEAIALLTKNPAQQIKVDAGHLSVGAEADLCIFDPDKSWEVTEETLLSRGKCTPFLGETLKGKVTHTFISGKALYSA